MLGHGQEGSRSRIDDHGSAQQGDAGRIEVQDPSLGTDDESHVRRRDGKASQLQIDAQVGAQWESRQNGDARCRAQITPGRDLGRRALDARLRILRACSGLRGGVDAAGQRDEEAKGEARSETGIRLVHRGVRRLKGDPTGRSLWVSITAGVRT